MSGGNHMKKIIEIKNLNFSYDQQPILNDVNLSIEKNSFTTILGPTGSGKSTLIKILLGLEKTDNCIKVDGKMLTEQTKIEIRKKIGIAFENPDTQIISPTVQKELMSALENQNDMKQNFRNIIKQFNLESILKKDPHKLSRGEKQKVTIATALLKSPKILILDEALAMIDHQSKMKILSILKKVHKETDITIIMISDDPNDCLFGDHIVLMKEGTVIKQGLKEEICKEEKLFNQLGLELPFMVDLSIKLQYYGLIDKIIYDMNEMVDTIWK